MLYNSFNFVKIITYTKKGGVLMEKHEHSQVNGNMANSMEELVVLGKEMEQMREENGTNGQPRTNDTIQFDHKDKTK